MVALSSLSLSPKTTHAQVSLAAVLLRFLGRSASLRVPLQAPGSGVEASPPSADKSGGWKCRDWSWSACIRAED